MTTGSYAYRPMKLDHHDPFEWCLALQQDWAEIVNPIDLFPETIALRTTFRGHHSHLGSFQWSKDRLNARNGLRGPQDACPPAGDASFFCATPSRQLPHRRPQYVPEALMCGIARPADGTRRRSSVVQQMGPVLVEFDDKIARDHLRTPSCTKFQGMPARYPAILLLHPDCIRCAQKTLSNPTTFCNWGETPHRTPWILASRFERTFESQGNNGTWRPSGNRYRCEAFPSG